MLIAQLTDVHLGFEPDNPSEFNRKRLDQVLKHFATIKPQPDIMIATGDLVDRGDARSYRRLKGALANCPWPIWPCIGNHDNRDNFIACFPELPLSDGFIQYEVDLGPVRMLVLDTLEPGRHGGGFCTLRADWLKVRLAEEREQPTVIVMHHPPVEVGIDWMNTDPEEPWVARFAEAIAGATNIRGILCGHLHRAISVGWRGNTVSICSSTAPQVALELAPMDPDKPDGRTMIVADPPAFALHFWNGRELVTHFDNADEHVMLARFDAGMIPLVKGLMTDRPGGKRY